MTVVPVYCHNCDTVFGADIAKGAILKNTFIGNNPIPCPLCGNIGYTIEGLYSSIGKSLEIIVSSFNSKNSLLAFAEKLLQLKKNKIEPTEFKNEVPELSSVKESLPKTRSELYAFIAILLTAISIFISTYTQFKSTDTSLSKESIENIVKESVQKYLEDTKVQQK